MGSLNQLATCWIGLWKQLRFKPQKDHLVDRFLFLSVKVMAPSTQEIPPTPSCPSKDPVPYKRIIIDLEKRPDLKKELEDATQLLKHAMCRTPDMDDDDAFDKICRKMEKIKPKSFPYAFYLLDDKDYDLQIFKDIHKGAVFWTDFRRDNILEPNQPDEYFEYENRHKLVYTRLKPLKIRSEGEKAMTVKEMCEAVAEAITKVEYSPGNHHFLEDIKIQMRNIDGEEVVTILFCCGS